jgi:hypothetical protein
LVLSGNAKGVLSSLNLTKGLRLVTTTFERNKIETCLEDVPSHPKSEGGDVESVSFTPSNTPAQPISDEIEEEKEENAQEPETLKKAKNKPEFYEVVLGDKNKALGHSVSSGVFQDNYRAQIVAVRQASGGDRIGSELENLQLKLGDCVLVMAEESFFVRYSKSPEFFVVSACGLTIDHIPDDRFYITFPRVFSNVLTKLLTFSKLGKHYQPITAAFMDPEKAAVERADHSRRVNLPWYPYLSLIGFVIMIAYTAAKDIDLLIPAIIHALFNIVSGIITTEEALGSIEGSVYVMVAASLGLGAGIEKSGLARNVAKALTQGVTDKLSLCIITSLLTTFSTSVISNNAAAAIIYPLALATAKEIGMNFKPLALIVAIAASIDFATPFGYQTNLMVQGPGGYKCIDYAKFGLPLNLLLPVLLALNANWYYGV